MQYSHGTCIHLIHSHVWCEPWLPTDMSGAGSSSTSGGSAAQPATSSAALHSLPLGAALHSLPQSGLSVPQIQIVEEAFHPHIKLTSGLMAEFKEAFLKAWHHPKVRTVADEVIKWDGRPIPQNKTVKIITLFNIVRARALCPPHVVIYEKKQLAARNPCFLNAEDLQRAGSASPWLYNKARIAFTRWRVWVPTALKWSGYQCITIKWFEVDKKTRYPGLQIDRAGKLVPYASMARNSTPRNEPRE